MANTPKKRRIGPAAIAAGAAELLAYRMMETLVKKGLLSQSEAAGAFVAAANDIRSGTEDDEPETASVGENIATSYETRAAWLLGRKGPGA
jgi:hypothetical protein